MSDLLAVFPATDEGHDRELLDEIAADRPLRVTVLIGGQDSDVVSEDSGPGAAVRDRLARLMATIERRTGATVLGMAGQRSQLVGLRFDRELAAHTPVPA